MIKPNILIWQWGRRGGGPRYTFELARALQQRNRFNLHLSLSHQSEIFDEFETLALPSLNIETYHNLPSAAWRSLCLPLLRQRFWRYVREKKIDLVVGTMSHVWNLPILLGRKPTPYLMVLHDALPHRGDDVPLRHMLLKREIAQADGVVTLTEHVRQLLCEQNSYPIGRSWVVPHGIFPYAIPSLKPYTQPMLRLLFFGRILPYKGLDLLLDALALLQSENVPVALTIAGAGDLGPYRAQLDVLRHVTIDQRWITEEEIGPLFQQADVAVLPYHAASQSGVIATAYAAGVPVVVTPVGGLVEQVIHEKTGLISNETTAASFATTLRRLHDDPVLHQLCAEGARHEAETNLSWQRITEQFEGAIHQMLVLGKR